MNFTFLSLTLYADLLTTKEPTSTWKAWQKIPLDVDHHWGALRQTVIAFTIMHCHAKRYNSFILFSVAYYHLYRKWKQFTGWINESIICTLRDNFTNRTIGSSYIMIGDIYILYIKGALCWHDGACSLMMITEQWGKGCSSMQCHPAKFLTG